MNQLLQPLREPILASLMEKRVIGLSALGFSIVQGGLMAFSLPGWPCPFRYQLGIPCPGCGFCRATFALWQGEWESALQYHALAPVLLTGLFIVIVTSLLPTGIREPLIKQIAQIEQRSGVTALILVALFGYWLVRLTFFTEPYLDLIMRG
ncbi:MAG: DUF2752 domain-containing protein [Chloroflexota bacterium]